MLHPCLPRYLNRYTADMLKAKNFFFFLYSHNLFFAFNVLKTATQPHQQPMMNHPSLPPGYAYFYGAAGMMPGSFQYGTPALYPVIIKELIFFFFFYLPLAFADRK